MPHDYNLRRDKIKRWPLQPKAYAVGYEIHKLDIEHEALGMAGLIGTLEKGEHLRRLMGDGPPLPSRNRDADRYDFERAMENQKEYDDACEEKLKRESEESGIPIELIDETRHLLRAAKQLVTDRSLDTFYNASADDKKRFLQQLSEDQRDWYLQMGKDRKKFEKEDDIHEALVDLNTAIEAILNHPKSPEKLKRLAQTVYIMATSDLPLYYEEAVKERLKGQTEHEAVP